MPLTINVGLSKKRSQNYQSEGVSINVTAELDQALLGRPEHLQREISGLYQQAEQALEHQIGPQAQRSPRTQPGQRSTQGAQNGHQGAQGNGARMATASQLRALQGICKRADLDLESAAHDEFGRGSTELDIRQASVLIDLLKQRVPAGKAGGR